MARARRPAQGSTTHLRYLRSIVGHGEDGQVVEVERTDWTDALVDNGNAEYVTQAEAEADADSADAEGE